MSARVWRLVRGSFNRYTAPRIHRLLSRLFVLEEINGHHRCPTYLYRWILLSTPWFKAYLHRFVADDWSLDLHDHPKRFLSIGLRGSYVEHQPHGRARVYSAPWCRSFPAQHVHRLTLPAGDCWTLVVVFQTVRSWGFWHHAENATGSGWRFIPWREYVAPDNKLADERKACS